MLQDTLHAMSLAASLMVMTAIAGTMVMAVMMVPVLMTMVVAAAAVLMLVMVVRVPLPVIMIVVVVVVVVPATAGTALGRSVLEPVKRHVPAYSKALRRSRGKNSSRRRCLAFSSKQGATYSL